MKKVLFLLVFAGLAVAVLHSCRKDGLDSRNPEPQQKTYSAQEMQIWRNLTAFNDKVKNGVRDEEFISPDSAMWYLEALYNVTEASNVTYDELVTDTTFYSLPVNENGEISLADVANVYNQMVVDMQNALDEFEEDYKYLILGDVYKTELARDGGAEMGLISGYGLNVLNLYEEFDTLDNWYYGNMYGRCDGQFLWQSDAGYELERRFNNPDIQYIIPHDSAHAVDIVSRTAFSSQYVGNIYGIKWPNGDTCINYLNLQYYLNQGHNEIIYKDSINGGKRPPNKDFLSIDVTSNNRGAIYIDSLYFHNYDIFYAKFINLPPIGD